MKESEKADLRSFIENEINFGYTFFRTAQLAGSQEHKEQAMGNAIKACDTAERFMIRLPQQEVPQQWRDRLAALRAIVG